MTGLYSLFKPSEFNLLLFWGEQSLLIPLSLLNIMHLDAFVALWCAHELMFWRLLVVSCICDFYYIYQCNTSMNSLVLRKWLLQILQIFFVCWEIGRINSVKFSRRRKHLQRWDSWITEVADQCLVFCLPPPSIFVLCTAIARTIVMGAVRKRKISSYGYEKKSLLKIATQE